MWILAGVGVLLFFGAIFTVFVIGLIAFAMRRKKPKLWEQLNQPLVANGALAAAIAWIGMRLTPNKPAGEDEGLAFIRAKRAIEEKQEAQRLFSGGGSTAPNE